MIKTTPETKALIDGLNARIKELEAQILPFKDMHGNQVTPGAKIRIVSNYNYQHLNGKEAEVIWNEKAGLYEYKYVEIRRMKEFPSSDDFYGIHEFELIK